jgi:uncharacterized protein (TIGR03437 family)
MYVLLGNGDGTFHAPKASSIAPISYASARAVDFYNNGKTDVFLVGTHADYPNGSLLTGAADGALTESRFSGVINDGGVYFALATADLQGNGRQGVIAAEQCGSIPTGVYTFLNGSLTPVTSMVPDICGADGAPPGFMEAAVADMDGDGKADLLLSDGFGMLYVTPGNGDGTFQGSKTGKFYTSAAPSSGGISGFDKYGSIATADFRGTGKLDVVMALAGKSVVMLKNGAGAAPAVPSGGVVSSASLTAIPAVAGSLASVFGSGFSYEAGTGTYFPNVLPTWLFGTAVTLNGSPIPLMWLSPTQVNVQIPWENAGLTQATLVLTRNQLASQTITVQLAPAAPALFAMNGQGTGQAAALIAGSSTIAAPVGAFSTSRPAHPGEYISLYGTGLGAVVEPQPLVTGQSTPERDTPFQPLRYSYYPTVQTTTVSIGGVPANVQFAGLAPDMIGVYQINVQIPASAPSGAAVPVVLSIGGAVANTVTLAIGPS